MSLRMNIEKSNCVIFHLMQKRIPKKVILFVNNQSFTEENCISYHGVYIDSNISWKSHINYIAKKIKRSIGILSKLRYFLNTKTLLSLYYTLVEPFFNSCVIAWGNAHQSTLQPLSNLQKKAIRIITFSSFT